MLTHFYTERKHFTNKKGLFYPKFFEFEEFFIVPFFYSSIQPQHAVMYLWQKYFWFSEFNKNTLWGWKFCSINIGCYWKFFTTKICLASGDSLAHCTTISISMDVQTILQIQNLSDYTKNILVDSSHNWFQFIGTCLIVGSNTCI